MAKQKRRHNTTASDPSPHENKDATEAHDVLPVKTSNKKKKKKKRKRKSSEIPLPSDDLGVAAKRPKVADVALQESKRVDSAAEDADDSITAREFPFPTDADDHCESPLEAYRDIVPLLKNLNNNKNCRVYDPYYCNGAMKEHLHELGFPNVYNVKEDCYQVWNDPQRYPQYDVLVTNPPYSGDHIERLVRHVVESNKPWCLLLPTWVHKKDYFQSLTKDLHPFYLVPHKRYVYRPPKDFRERKKSDVHQKSSPFCSMWYCCYSGGNPDGNNKTGNQQQRWIRTFQQSDRKSHCDLARSKSALRDLRRKPKRR